jgi:hypothetical protein
MSLKRFGIFMFDLLSTSEVWGLEGTKGSEVAVVVLAAAGIVWQRQAFQVPVGTQAAQFFLLDR